MPDLDCWRIGYLEKLLVQRLQAKLQPDENEEAYLSTLIESLVST